MIQLVFKKGIDEYSAGIKVPSKKVNDSIPITLDTGSPITTICVQNLIKISNESKDDIFRKLLNAKSVGNTINFGVYGHQDTKESRDFAPYLLEDMIMCGVHINYFLFWVDVTNLAQTAITSTLFGYDYIKQGRKVFDKEDNFHILVDQEFTLDIRELNGTLSKHTNSINTLNELIKTKNKSGYMNAKRSANIVHCRVMYWNKMLKQIEVENNGTRIPIPLNRIRKDNNNWPYVECNNEVIKLYKGESALPNDILRWFKTNGFRLPRKRASK